MTYFSPSTCKLLSEKGCVASDGDLVMCLGHDYYEDDEDTPTFEKCEYDLPIEDGYCPSADMVCEYTVPAFSAADFLASPSAKENCIKLWGEEETNQALFEHYTWPSGITTQEEVARKNFHYQAHQLLDLILSGESGEEYIKKALEET